MSSYGLYILSNKENLEKKYNLDNLGVFKPTRRHPFFWLTEKKGYESQWKLILLEFMWAIASGFHYKIYYFKQDGEIVHTTYCIYQCYKFSFINKRTDCVFGPSRTGENYRGKGIFPAVLQYLCDTEKKMVGIYIRLFVMRIFRQ